MNGNKQPQLFVGIAPVLSTRALWVRSYKTWDDFGGSVSSTAVLDIVSIAGSWYIGYSESSHHTWTISSGTPDQDQADTLKRLTNGYGFGSYNGPDSRSLVFPAWLAVFIVAAAAILPWMRRLPYRFSLRTLLMATTLIAAGLGVLVWLSR
jgi:hypothetical protein